MAFSFTRLLLEHTEIEVYSRGLEYARKNKVKITKTTNNSCSAIVSGSSKYTIYLGFKRIGSPKYECTCPYYSEHNGIVCKHIICSALQWDRSRTIPDPDNETLKHLCIPKPTTITSRDITKLYNNPLQADLNILRNASSEIGWTRPHALLPTAPSVCNKEIISVSDIKKGISEIRSWSRKSRYDPYFCAGEVIAGLCELIRNVKINFRLFTPSEKVSSIKLLVDFHKEIVTSIIDSSDGVHIFSESHLDDLLDNEVKTETGFTAREHTILRQLKKEIGNY